MSEAAAQRPVASLPHDPQAERAVIGCALLDKQIGLQLLDTLSPDDFYTPMHALIWRAMQDLAGANEPVEIPAVFGRLDGSSPSAPDFGYLIDSTRLGIAASSGLYYAERVQDRALARQALAHSQELGRRAMGGDSAPAIQAFMTDAAVDIGLRAGTALEPAGATAWQVMELIEEAGKGGAKPQGVGIGYVDLDRVLQNLRPGQLITIASRPGVGKTVTGMDAARHVSLKLNEPVIVFSLEMSKIELMQRILSAEARVDLAAIRSGDVRSDRDWQRLGEATSNLSAAPLYIDDTPGISIPEIRSRCRRQAQRVGKLGLIVIDYIQLVQTPDTGRRSEMSRQQEVAQFSRGLKMMAKELGVPVIVLAQLNRDNEKRPDKRPQLSDLRESGAIEQDSDIVVLIHRPDMYDENDAPGQVLMIVPKNRNGERHSSGVILTAVLNQAHFANAALGGPVIV